MKRLHCFVAWLLIYFAGCSTKYVSYTRLTEPFRQKTRIYVDVAAPVPFLGLAYMGMREDIIESITNDLRMNAFPDLAGGNDCEMIVKVVVQDISHSCITGAGNAVITLTILNAENRHVKDYLGTGSTGWQFSNASGITKAVKSAMEIVKRKLMKDRDEIIRAIEERQKSDAGQ